MRFGIDVDDVVADYNSAFVREINNIWPGRLPITCEREDLSHWGDLSDDEVNLVRKLIDKKPNWWLSLQACFENVRAIATHRIRHPEDEIFYVTARHEVTGMPAMHQTQVWLQECGIGGLGTAVIVDSSGDKSAIFNALECDANIDDRLETVLEHHSKTVGACLLDRSWNRKDRPAYLRTCANLEEFFRRT